jgi:cytochrome c-type biogenesis protein CcmF
MLTLLDLPDEPGGEIGVRVIVQPLVVWLWIGGGVMALGTVLAAVPSRLARRPTDPVSVTVGEAGTSTAGRATDDAGHDGEGGGDGRSEADGSPSGEPRPVEVSSP